MNKLTEERASHIVIKSVNIRTQLGSVLKFTNDGDIVYNNNLILIEKGN